jgi:ABC-type multidrug transport system ATPase subunit
MSTDRVMLKQSQTASKNN